MLARRGLERRVADCDRRFAHSLEVMRVKHGRVSTRPSSRLTIDYDGAALKEIFEKGFGFALRHVLFLMPDDIRHSIAFAKQRAQFAHEWIHRDTTVGFTRSPAVEKADRGTHERYRPGRKASSKLLVRRIGDRDFHHVHPPQFIEVQHRWPCCASS